MIADGDRTMFEGIYQVPPGHYLLATPQRFQAVPYWDLTYPTADHPAPAYSEQEHVERMREALRESIRLRLRADVPVGVYLSGGLDSCSLLALRRPAHGSLRPSRSRSRRPSTRSRRRGDGRPVRTSHLPHAGGPVADHFADAIWQCGPSRATRLRRQVPAPRRCATSASGGAHRRGVGRDPGGYPFFRQDMLLFGDPDATPEARTARVRELQLSNRHLGGFGMPVGAALSTDAVGRVLGYVPTWIGNRGIAGKRMQGLLSAEFAAEFPGRDPYQMFLNRIDLPEGAPRDPLNQSMWLWLKAVFPNKLLNFLGDRMEMAHSIEGRTPFLDHPLAELVCQMPVSMKVHGMTEKYVLREAARPFLTDTSTSPAPSWRRPSGPAARAGRGRQVARPVPFFDRKAVIRFLTTSRTCRPRDALSTTRPGSRCFDLHAAGAHGM
jgi:asparagine synthase (glutamine-hydrolysing)